MLDERGEIFSVVMIIGEVERIAFEGLIPKACLRDLFCKGIDCVVSDSAFCFKLKHN